MYAEGWLKDAEGCFLTALALAGRKFRTILPILGLTSSDQRVVNSASLPLYPPSQY